MPQPEHVPVMLEEVLRMLPLRPGACVVDGTIGLAGHAAEMAERIRPGGLLVGLDWDKDMLEVAREKLEGVREVDVRLFHADYRELPESLAQAAGELGRPPVADAILLDLGLNAAQIADPDRGISFQANGPLDMRMDRSRGETAAAVLNRLSEREIERMLLDLGDERWARKIAQTIVERRRKAPLKTTDDLVACVLDAIPPAKRDRRIHPATRTFQAVRIYVNQELDRLQEAIEAASRCLAPGGVLVTLAYHSGEDRAAKRAMKSLSVADGFEELLKKPAVPTDTEIARNPKSRSAKLRAIKRTEAS